MDAQISELQQKLDSAHSHFVEVANQLGPTRQNRAGVCGEWSPKDVVAHLVGWDASLKQLIVDIEHFEPPYDVDGFNQCSVDTRTALSWADVMQELALNFSALMDALTTVEPSMKIYDRVTSWIAGRIEDYQLHTSQLELWLGEKA